MLTKCWNCSGTDMFFFSSSAYGLDFRCKRCGTEWRVTVLKARNDNLEKEKAS